LTKQEWLKARQKGIGGSDAAAVLGINPYKTNIELWEEKTGRREPEDISGKAYVKYGVEAEKPLRELFKLDYPEYKVSHKERQIIYHPVHKFLFATLDGNLTHRETGAKGFLEIKTTNILSSMHKEKWDDKIPDNYYTQCLHYFNVTGYDFCVLKAYLVSEWGGERRINTRHYFIQRSEVEQDIKYLSDREIEFWTVNVLGNKRPGLILPPI
jgi:putative phage-type endonuclease